MSLKRSDLQRFIRKLENKVWLDPEISQANHGGEVQGDALKNFKSIGNRLSLFLIDDLEKIPRIMAAIACAKSLDSVDYAVFESALLDEHDIQYEKCPGDTIDLDVNQLHVDLVGLTAGKIHVLAKVIQDHAKLERLSRKQVEKAIRDGIENGFLPKERVKAISV